MSTTWKPADAVQPPTASSARRCLRGRLAALAVLGTALTACSADPESEATAASELEPAPADQQLSEVCGDSVTVQLQWQPQSDMGALFQMLGPGHTVDTEKKLVTGPLVAQGKDTGIGLTLRAGGPAIGFQSVTSQMYVDPSIDFGLVHTDQMIASSGEQPVVGVTPLLTHTPAMLMWNPDEFGDDFSLTELADSGATIVVSPEQIFPAWLVAKGFATSDQIDPSYDGSPARFVADPTIVQQGFANAEPYTYENDTPAWNRPVSYQLLKDAGYDPYASNFSVRADQLEDKAPCLERLVPIIQQAGADYISEPDETNAIIAEVVAADPSMSPYSVGQATFSAELLRDEGLIAEEDGTFGGYDTARTTAFVDEVAPIVRAQGNPVAEHVTAEDLFTNRFVNESVRLQ